MKCPKCSAAMAKVVHEGIEVDRCDGCHGLWFDILEHEDLKAISGSEVIDSGPAETGRANDAIRAIRCPACDVPMIRMVVAAQPHISYEACTVCYGVYFDAGEFSDFREETFAESWRSLFGKPRTDV
jgi:Zn-finger nucleic acid-binding protein